MPRGSVLLANYDRNKQTDNPVDFNCGSNMIRPLLNDVTLTQVNAFQVPFNELFVGMFFRYEHSNVC